MDSRSRWLHYQRQINIQQLSSFKWYPKCKLKAGIKPLGWVFVITFFRRAFPTLLLGSWNIVGNICCLELDTKQNSLHAAHFYEQPLHCIWMSQYVVVWNNPYKGWGHLLPRTRWKLGIMIFRGTLRYDANVCINSLRILCIFLILNKVYFN